jgi:hypothetical protein
MASAQEGVLGCIPAPNPGTAITRWNTAIGFALDMFYDRSRSPLTITAVTLIDPHNLLLHGALVYEMVHNAHPLILEDAWSTIGQHAPPQAWAARQPVPGAVMPPENAAPEVHGHRNPASNVYEVVPDISVQKPGGGWAIGVAITYKVGLRTYHFKAYGGYAIGVSRAQSATYCTPQLNAIQKAFRNLKQAT